MVEDDKIVYFIFYKNISKLIFIFDFDDADLNTNFKFKFDFKKLFYYIISNSMTDIISLSKKEKKQKYDFAGLSREEYDKKRYELNKDKISQKYKEHKDEVKLKYEENKDYLKLKSKILQTKYRNSYHLLKKTQV